MSDCIIYAPLTKVETTSDGGREVSGFATLEKPDKSGEIADYDTTVQAFKMWSDEIQAASGGKSLGNLREMHQPKAVGKVIDWFPTEKSEQGDLVKGIYVTVRVPPSQRETIEKLDEGILTGFSIGGRYIKKWMDTALGKMRYTPKLSELSLVDNPAVPGATFDVVKGERIVLGEENEELQKQAQETDKGGGNSSDNDQAEKPSDGEGVEKTAQSELLKALLEAKQSGELEQILEVLQKAELSAEAAPQAGEPVKPEGDLLVKNDEPAKPEVESVVKNEEPAKPEDEPVAKATESEELKKYNVAISRQRMAHLEHARRHIQAAMTGEDYGPDDHTNVESSVHVADVADNSGAETEVVAKLMGTSLQKAAGFSFEEDLQKADLAKASDLSRVAESIGQVLDVLKVYDARLKKIEEQPALTQPPMLSGVQPVFKFSGQAESDPQQSRQMLEELTKDPSIPLAVRQKIGMELAKLDSPFHRP